MPRDVLIEGVGAVGGVLAGQMIAAGATPVLVTGNEAIAAAIRRNGIRLLADGRRIAVPAEADAHLEELPAGRRFDLAVLAMKASSVVAAARATLPLLAEDGVVVTLQNGIVVDAVAEAVGPERVLAGIVAWGAEMKEPGVYEKTSRGRTILGEPNGRLTGRLVDAGLALRDAAPVVLSTNVRGALWAKLAVNCMITTPGAVSGERLGALLRRRAARRVLLAAYREVVDTAEAAGIALEGVALPPRLLYLPVRAPLPIRVAKHLIARLVGLPYRRLKSSMLQSLERGRPTEIGFLNGVVVARAAELGVPAPVNGALVELVSEIEAGRARPEPSHLDRIAEAVA